MSTRARRRPHALTPPRSTPSGHADPERLLLEQIADGALDPHLAAIAQAIDARQRLLHTVRSVTALATLVVGDRMRVNRHARPRYLHGAEGTVVALDDRTATVELTIRSAASPAARFAVPRSPWTGSARCPRREHRSRDAGSRGSAQLDDLIDEMTVDCCGEDEALTGFENAFDEDPSLPCPGEEP